MEESTVKKSKKILKITLSVLLAAVILCGVFFAGFFTHMLTRPAAINSYEWALGVIDNNYCGERREGKITVNLDGYTKEEISLKALAGTLDDYSTYYTAAEYAEVLKDNSGEKSGIGVTTNFIAGKGAYVVSVAGNSPAFLKNVQVGDVFTAGKADGAERVEFKTAADFSGFVGERAKGEKFTLYTESGSYELSKEEYAASYAAMFTSKAEYGFCYGGEEDYYYRLTTKMDFLPEDAAYIKLSQFYGNAAAEVGYLISKFNEEGKNKLILDLRNNGGGYVSVMQNMSGYFLSGGNHPREAMIAEYKDGSKDAFWWRNYPAEAAVNDGTEIYVLANSGTASASEALIGVLISYGAVKYENVIISDYTENYLNWAGANAKTARTYGKGIMQSTFRNDLTGEAFKLTTARILWPNGKCIHGAGLSKADGCRLAPADWTATANDEELRFTVENYL